MKSLSDLHKRIISSIILAPLAITLIYWGPPYSTGLSIAIAFAMIFEWIIMCLSTRRPDTKGSLLFFGGLIYILIGSLFLIFLLEIPEGLGAKILFILLIIVWATDTGAYFVGRRLKGPKLAPKISPNKTWSGFFGGLLSGTLLGSFGVYLIGGATEWMLFAPIVLVLSCIGQLGDLLESAAKRFWGVKESSHLIPGHGGILDRLDSLLGIAFVLAIWQAFM